MKINVFIILFLTLFIGCKEEFILEDTNYNPILVIDGMITNEPGPYTINLTQSSPVNNEQKIPFERCSVTLYENNVRIDVLEEQSPGVYVTSKSTQGIIGNSYMIHIATPEAKEYETEPQILYAPVDISSIYAEIIYKNDEEYVNGLPGYQFYIDTKESPVKETYFLWQIDETYEYTNEYKINRFFLGTDLRFDYGVLVEHEIENDTLIDYINNKVYTCWRTKTIGYHITGRTSNLNTAQIVKQPLNFVSTSSKRLTNRYSILVKQYNINKEAYTYWNAVEEQSSDENFLVSTQPYSILGNVKNINDPSDWVYGYFNVASVSKKRIFVDPPDEDFYIEKCNVVTDPGAIKDMLDNTAPPFFYVQTSRGEGIINNACVDCRNEGGTNVKPDFWED